MTNKQIERFHTMKNFGLLKAAYLAIVGTSNNGGEADYGVPPEAKRQLLLDINKLVAAVECRCEAIARALPPEY